MSMWNPDQETYVDYLDRTYSPTDPGVGAGAPEWQQRGFANYDAFASAYGLNPSSTPTTPTSPDAAPPPSGVGAPAPDLTNDQKSAKAELEATLQQYGLTSLGDKVWQSYLGGLPINQIMLDVRNTPEYKARFPAMDALAQKGHAMTEQQYIDYEKNATQVMRQAGLPAGFYDQPDDFTQFIANEVSPTELQDRVKMASDAALTAPPETKDALARLYGVGQGELTAYFLDPAVAEPLLTQRWTASQLAGSATRTGFGDLSQGQAEGLAQLGVTQPNADKGFSDLANSAQLFNPLDSGEDSIGTDTQLAVQFGGNAAAQQAIQARIARRKAAFASGGGFADNGKGLTGLGTTTTT